MKPPNSSVDTKTANGLFQSALLNKREAHGAAHLTLFSSCSLCIQYFYWFCLGRISFNSMDVQQTAQEEQKRKKEQVVGVFLNTAGAQVKEKEYFVIV